MASCAAALRDRPNMVCHSLTALPLRWVGGRVGGRGRKRRGSECSVQSVRRPGSAAVHRASQPADGSAVCTVPGRLTGPHHRAGGAHIHQVYADQDQVWASARVRGWVTHAPARGSGHSSRVCAQKWTWRGGASCHCQRVTRVRFAGCVPPAHAPRAPCLCWRPGRLAAAGPASPARARCRRGALCMPVWPVRRRLAAVPVAPRLWWSETHRRAA